MPDCPLIRQQDYPATPRCAGTYNTLIFNIISITSNCRGKTKLHCRLFIYK